MSLDYLSTVLVITLINLLTVLGLSLLTGFTGLFSFGHAGFMAIGAYFAGYVTSRLHLSFYLGILVAAAVAAIVAWGLGKLTLKLKGDYFCIATLGFGEAVRQIFENVEVFGGARGLTGIPYETNLLNLGITVVVVVIILANLISSRHGRNMVAVREEELAAQMAGINVVRYKMIAFIISAVLAAIAGAFFAHNMTYIQPKNFSMDKSTELTIMVILGGIGSLSGSIVSAFLLTILTEILRDFAAWRYVLYGAVVIFVMIARPKGLMGGIELTPSSIKKWLTLRAQKKEASSSARPTTPA